MPELMIKDIDEEIVQRLKHRAIFHGVTVEEEAKDILTQTIGYKRLSREEFIQKATELREMAGPQKTDSIDLIREDRDSR